jgi:thiol-disulfide isomerase/thioredoxin
MKDIQEEGNISVNSLNSLNPMRYDLEAIVDSSEPISEYLKASEEETTKFSERRAEYKLNGDAVEGIRAKVGDVVVVVFSAEWCPDCFRNVPVLGLLNEETGLEVRVFGHLKRNIMTPDERWAIPPSPPEVKEFNVIKIPLITVLNRDGEKLGEIVENPPKGQTLETALLEILKGA